MAINDFGTRSAFYTSQKLGLINPSYLSGICGNDKGINEIFGIMITYHSLNIVFLTL